MYNLYTKDKYSNMQTTNTATYTKHKNTLHIQNIYQNKNIPIKTQFHMTIPYTYNN